MFTSSRILRYLLCLVAIVAFLAVGCGIQGGCQPRDLLPPDDNSSNPPPTPPLPAADLSLKIAPGEGGVMPDLAPLNIVALHKPNSLQYDGQCLKCHADVLTETTLSSSVLTAHQTMIPEMWEFGYDADVGVRNQDCRACHDSVWTTPDNPAVDLRKQVPVVLCSDCHGPPGSPPLYQIGGRQ